MKGWEICLMLKNNYKTYIIASGLGAGRYGAQLGAWDIYYSLADMSSRFQIENVFYNASTKSKLDIIPDITDLLSEFNITFQKKYKNTDKYLFITGDHSNAIGVWSAISNSTEEDIGLIWIDSHLDSHTPKTSLSKNVHGMPIAHLMGYGDKGLRSLINKKIKPENICFIGSNSYEPAEIDFINKHNIKTFFLKDINENNINGIFTEAVDHVSKNTRKFGVSFDVDSLSHSDAPGTGCYTQIGLNLSAVINNLRILSEHEKFIALEITEYNPLLDDKRKTFNVIISIIKAIL